MNSFMGWIGGKRLLRKTIIAMMPEHHVYVEVFGGAGWVLFGKEPSEVECWNDLNGDLVNLFRIVRNHSGRFKRRLYYLLSSREEYYNFQKAIKIGKFRDEVDRAIAFYYLLKSSFGSGVFTGWGFSTTQPPRSLITVDIDKARERLSRVYIENTSFKKLIPNWDRKTTLFYLDPPYYMLLNKSGRSYYSCTFNKEDHLQLRDVLKGISGAFILSYDNDPTVRKLYSRFNIRETKPVLYSMNKRPETPTRRMTELIITNF